MQTALAALLGVLVGVALCAVPLTLLWRELRIAQDRLLSSWNAGAVLAPRPVMPEKQAPEIELSPTLLEYVGDWENPSDQERAAAEIRNWLAEGKHEAEIVRILEHRQSSL